MDKEDFLSNNRVDSETWGLANIDWSVLSEIASDYNAQLDSLRDTAELFSRIIQRFSAVHSVRWRVKETSHLLEKIVRKRAANNEKYKDINKDNYFAIVSDLVGIRVLHLFKNEYLSIDADLKKNWEPIETPIAYVREGDSSSLMEKLKELGFDVKLHSDGYRSVHYICSSQHLRRKILVEIQVRTIFEEAWSEIDHQVRYPNFSDSPLVSYFLTIFNRLAGSADEMGTFVKDLTSELDGMNAKLIDANREKEEAFMAMDRMISDLEQGKQQDAETRKKIGELQDEIRKLKGISSVGNRKDAALAAMTIASMQPREPTSISREIYSNGTAAEMVRQMEASEKSKRDNLLELAHQQCISSVAMAEAARYKGFAGSSVMESFCNKSAGSALSSTLLSPYEQMRGKPESK
ncbi:RelA/SpoT domain-containing protein [Rivihabitans pingtungensis]|uniref:RelA/SpoT domain-containing protein n=1 Tax=Rivihabitans pingtungensis TaxID=1054498 RepID=UPI002355240F|nr:hypothetical protein [Rivihabitans pingtungensis]MCK6437210.1 hypothetical protein [Rivihabitans pingtungensis]